MVWPPAVEPGRATIVSHEFMSRWGFIGAAVIDISLEITHGPVIIHSGPASILRECVKNEHARRAWRSTSAVRRA